MIFLVRQL